MLIPLEKFKEQNQPCFIAWNYGQVTANDKTYKIHYVNVGGANYPYVNLPDVRVECRYESGIKRRSELPENNKIKLINIHKRALKHKEYTFDNITYYILGIGYDAIKAEKNGRTRYFRYHSLEGQYLLTKLFNIIQEMML